MKKSIIYTALTAIAAVAFSATTFAQLPESYVESGKRVEQLRELSDLPKETGKPSIDGLAADARSAAAMAVAVSERLVALYNSPNLTDALALGVEITAETLAVKSAVEKIQPATEEMKKEKNPLKAKNLIASVNYSQKALQLVGEENVFHAQAIAEIIKSLENK
jgi:hypothetical protein